MCITRRGNSARIYSLRRGYLCTPIPCSRYILQSDFITSLDLHHEWKVTIPSPPSTPLEFDRVPIRARCICPPACLPAWPTWMTRYPRAANGRRGRRDGRGGGGIAKRDSEGMPGAGPNVLPVGPYRKDTTRRDLILAAYIREYERRMRAGKDGEAPPGMRAKVR